MKSSREQASEPASTLYIACTAALAALILGLIIFLLIRGFQWQAALADLRAEPGIEILSVERSGFFKKRLLGLRDPLAPPAEEILLGNNIGPRSVELFLTEYHSLNTPYAIAREEQNMGKLESTRDSLIEAVGKFAEEIQSKRETDLEKITQMLFEAKFPEEMKSAEIEWENGEWLVEGELYEPTRSRFVAAAPDYLVEGELNYSKLVNLTKTRTESLGTQIKGTNLMTVDLDGEFTHVDQVIRLLNDYDEVCEVSKMPSPRLRIRVVSPESDETEDLRIASLWKKLTVDGGIDPARFEETILLLPEDGKAINENAEDDLLAFLEILPEHD